MSEELKKLLEDYKNGDDTHSDFVSKVMNQLNKEQKFYCELLIAAHVRKVLEEM